MNGRYILRGKEVIPVDDLMEWAENFEKSDRKIARDEIGDVVVSTVFLGLDYEMFGSSLPIVFETMIFEGEHDGYQERYRTYDEAVKGHKKAVLLVASSLKKGDER